MKVYLDKLSFYVSVFSTVAPKFPHQNDQTCLFSDLTYVVPLHTLTYTQTHTCHYCSHHLSQFQLFLSCVAVIE